RGRRAAERRGVLAHVFPPNVFERAVARAVHTVGRGIAENYVLQRAAVRDLEQRALAFLLTARAERARADEALHRAIVGAGNLNRRRHVLRSARRRRTRA